MLSLLMCPFFHQPTLHSGIFNKLVGASVAVAVGMKIYTTGEHNKSLAKEKQTPLTTKGHPYVDATVEFAEYAASIGGLVFSKTTEYCKQAESALHRQREITLPALLEKYYPSSSESVEEKKAALEKAKKKIEESTPAEKDAKKEEFVGDGKSLDNTLSPAPSTPNEGQK